MGVHVVELSSDSEDEGTKKKYIPAVSSDLVHSEVDNGSRSCPVGKDTELVDTASKVRSTKTRKALSVEEVRRLIKDVEFGKLRLPDLQSYSRVEGLIIGGTKEVLIDRIKTRIQILEQGVTKYSSESFTVECSDRGGVCMGDVVQFEQRVYDNFTPFQKNPVPAGIRVVAGRVVKESYGEKRHQHTFTIEILRSSGYKALAPMQRLQNKGRNLYLFGVRRQIWEDEKMRLTVLQEKHERGAAAKGRPRRHKPLTGDVSAQASIVRSSTTRKRKHAEPRNARVPVSVVSHGSAVGGKKRKKIPTVVHNGKCEGSKPKKTRLMIQQPGCKGLKKKQAQKVFPKLQSKQALENGGKAKTKGSKAEKRRAKKWRRRERREAERLVGACKVTGGTKEANISKAEKVSGGTKETNISKEEKNREKCRRRQERLNAYRLRAKRAKTEGQVKG